MPEFAARADRGRLRQIRRRFLPDAADGLRDQEGRRAALQAGPAGQDGGARAALRPRLRARDPGASACRRSISASCAARAFTSAPTPTTSARTSAAARISSNCAAPSPAGSTSTARSPWMKSQTGPAEAIRSKILTPAGGLAAARRVSALELALQCACADSLQRIRFEVANDGSMLRNPLPPSRSSPAFPGPSTWPSASSMASISAIAPSSSARWPMPRAGGGTAVAVTFDPHPAQILRPGKRPAPADRHRAQAAAHPRPRHRDPSWSSLSPRLRRHAAGGIRPAIARRLPAAAGNLRRPRVVLRPRPRRQSRNAARAWATSSALMKSACPPSQIDGEIVEQHRHPRRRRDRRSRPRRAPAGPRIHHPRHRGRAATARPHTRLSHREPQRAQRAIPAQRRLRRRPPTGATSRSKAWSISASAPRSRSASRRARCWNCTSSISTRTSTAKTSK